MHELLLHLLGDYVLQTEQMALRKLHNWGWAVIHALVYSVPFLLYLNIVNGSWTRGWLAWAVIASTHAIIDRLAVATTICRLKNLLWFGSGAPEKEQHTGYGIETPPFIRFWLVVIVDNTLHLIINHVALNYLNR
ncbi:MAG: DUF3307 domain-containing protein [Proteobacteria bacterium]|nr:DUF3307 domain-containing protein [Pseudomonadota bacterium]NDE97594.1 DUF3307 domain-containing protein [Verrucomicrobiota bacterium]